MLVTGRGNQLQILDAVIACVFIAMMDLAAFWNWPMNAFPNISVQKRPRPAEILAVT
jgi:hypothetical protein